MHENLLRNHLILATILLTVGLVGIMSRSNRASIFVGVQIALQSAALIWCAFGSYHQTATGQVGGLLVLGVAAALSPVVAVLFMKGLAAGPAWLPRESLEVEDARDPGRSDFPAGLRQVAEATAEETASAEQT